MIKKLKDKIVKRKIAYFEYSEWEEHYNPIGLLKLAHSLEKGMGLPSVKQGYGIDKAICAVVSFGKYKESFKCLCAQRKSVAEISAKF